MILENKGTAHISVNKYIVFVSVVPKADYLRLIDVGCDIYSRNEYGHQQTVADNELLFKYKWEQEDRIYKMIQEVENDRETSKGSQDGTGTNADSAD